MARRSNTVSGPRPSKVTKTYKPQASLKTGSHVSSKAASKDVQPTINWPTIEIDRGFNGFDLLPMPLPRKGSLLEEARKPSNIIQSNPFKGASLNPTHHHVVQEQEWAAASQYKQCTMGNDVAINIGDCVHVQPDPSQAGDPNAPVKGWFAKVLEIRAGDSAHVFFRIYWLYRPEDLPKGRQPYHAANELIASNDMAIIDSLTVHDVADVVHWNEDESQAETLYTTQLFWRQTLDVTGKTPRLSTLPKHCIERTPLNPDFLTVQCQSCKKWLHGPCLKTEALRKVYNRNSIPFPIKVTTSSKGKGHLEQKGDNKPAFTADLDELASGKVQLIITDHRPLKGPTSRPEPIECILCSTTIEEAVTNEEPTTAVSFLGPRTPAKQCADTDEEEDTPASNTISSPAILRETAIGGSQCKVLNQKPTEPAQNYHVVYARKASRKRKWLTKEKPKENKAKKIKVDQPPTTPPPPPSQDVTPGVLLSASRTLSRFLPWPAR